MSEPSPQETAARPSAGSGSTRFRELSPRVDAIVGGALALLAFIGLAWAIQLPRFLGLTIFLQQYLGAFLALSAALVFLISKPRVAMGDRIPWYDAAASAAALAVGAYCVLIYPRIADSLSIVTWDKVLFGVVTVVLLLEATRRLFGLTLVILVVVLCLYARYGYVLPGLLYTRGSRVRGHLP